MYGLDFSVESKELNPDQPDFGYGLYRLQAYKENEGVRVKLGGG